MMLSRPAWIDRFRPGKPRTAVNGFPAAPRPQVGPGENRTPVPGFADLCLCRSATGPNQEIVAKLIGRRRIDEGGCWVWTGAINDSGYGAVLAWGRVRYVHRIVAAIFLGLDLEDPDLLVCHSCDVRSCFNPAHLWIGSASDNVQDMIAKGRARWSEENLASRSPRPAGECSRDREERQR